MRKVLAALDEPARGRWGDSNRIASGLVPVFRDELGAVVTIRRYPTERLLFVLSLLLTAVWPTSEAFAYENQLTIGGNLGFAERIADEGPRHGGTFGISSSIGLDDIWSARGRFSYSVHHAPGFLHAFFLSAEILYLIDILEFVPYFGGGPDGVATLWNDQLEIDFALHAVVGVDYLFSREVIFGLEVLPLFFLTRPSTQLAQLSVIFTVSYSFEL